MKKLCIRSALPALCLLVLLVLLPAPAQATDGIAIDEAHFPDPEFRELIRVRFDGDEDLTLSAEELAAAKSLVLLPGNIHSLAGIEYFTELEILDCHENAISRLDLRQNTRLLELKCQNNQLTELDLRHNPALTYLDCSANQLTELDLRHNSALRDLYCFHNRIVILDLSANTDLRRLECNNNELTELDVHNIDNLQMLDCSTNLLTSLDVSENKYLTNLNCSYNQLSQLRFYNLLKTFSCGYNRLTELDVRECTLLTRLICCDNQLASLDISRNTALTSLNCERNQATIVLTAESSFDLSTLPGFDPERAEQWVGGTVSDGILTVAPEASQVTYSYRCGEELQCSFTLLPVAHVHDFGPWEQETPAVCGKEGSEVRTCGCGKAERRTIPPLEHDYVSQLHFVSNDTGHGRTCCLCGSIEPLQPHSPDPDGKCTVCLYDPNPVIPPEPIHTEPAPTQPVPTQSAPPAPSSPTQPTSPATAPTASAPTQPPAQPGSSGHGLWIGLCGLLGAAVLTLLLLLRKSRKAAQ